jgi:hypothetical protein
MGQPFVASAVGELLERVTGSVAVKDGRLTVTDEAGLREGTIADVVWSATFSDDPDVWPGPDGSRGTG